MELLSASKQWAERPADESFQSIDELHQAAMLFRDNAAEAPGVRYSGIRVGVRGDDVVLQDTNGGGAELNHWAFGQLCQRVGAPAGYMRGLPPTLVAQNINHGLARRGKDDEEKANILLHRNGGFMVRAFLSEQYTRIWNSDVTARLSRLEGWNPAPPAFDGKRGLYLSAEDMFVFLVDNNRRIFEKDPGGGLSRGFFCWNSEVGKQSFGVCTFLYAYVCGNHIVWGAENVRELRIRHVGAANQRVFGQLQAELRAYADQAGSEDEARVIACKNHTLGASKEEVLDAVFGLKTAGISRKLAGQAYELAEEREDWYGNPRSVWAMGNAITEIARDVEHADRRVEMERMAGKLFEVALA